MPAPVQSFSADQLLAVWETGRRQHPLDRALTILAAAAPGTSRAALADLSVGERDARLLHLRALVVGPRAEGLAECPRCAERLEFEIETTDFARPKEMPPAAPEITVRGRQLRFRLPTSRDLVQAVAASDSHAALRALIASCCDLPVEKDLPNELVEALGRAMLAADSQAEITLELNCPACAQRWSLLFDVAEFFWTEIAAGAQRLLREIDALARAYGWSEREILDLSPQRRHTYLELVSA